MKNKIKAIIWAVIMTVLLVGCGRDKGVEVNGYSRFKVVEEYKDGVVLVDKDTGIGYFKRSAAIFPLYDSEGRLYRPNGYRDFGE